MSSVHAVTILNTCVSVCLSATKIATRVYNYLEVEAMRQRATTVDFSVQPGVELQNFLGGVFSTHGIASLGRVPLTGNRNKGIL